MQRVWSSKVGACLSCVLLMSYIIGLLVFLVIFYLLACFTETQKQLHKSLVCAGGKGGEKGKNQQPRSGSTKDLAMTDSQAKLDAATAAVVAARAQEQSALDHVRGADRRLVQCRVQFMTAMAGAMVWLKPGDASHAAKLIGASDRDADIVETAGSKHQMPLMLQKSPSMMPKESSRVQMSRCSKHGNSCSKPCSRRPRWWRKRMACELRVAGRQ